MNIVSRLTVRHLLSNRKRTIVTILGIAASTALISAIIMGVFSFFSFFAQVSVNSDGYAHASFEDITREQAAELESDKRISAVGISDTEETITGIRLDSGKEDRFRTGNIEHADRGYYEMMVVSEYEGTLPADSGEIAVEEKFLKENGLDIQIGDKLTFEQGYRYIIDDDEGLVYLAGNYRSEEGFEPVSTETCIVTAILHGNRPTTGWDVLRGMDESYYPAPDKAQVRIILNRADHTSIRQIKDIVRDHGIGKYEYNTEYMLSVFAFEGSGGTYRAFFMMMGVALLIVIATSVILIVNSVEMSYTERIRYLGMLASVGATSWQKRFSIYFEGLILGLIGIPLGLLFGYIGTRITLSVLGRKVLEANIIAGAEGMQGSIPVVCKPFIILVIVVFSAVTIFVSTLIPGMKAARITPIDALRQTNTIRMRARKLRVNPLIRKVFGYEGELAYKNILRNGAKGKVITVTIAISVIMFLTISYFCSSVARANQYEFDLPCQLFVSCAYDEIDGLRSEISSMDGVERVFTAMSIDFLFEKKDKEKVQLANTDIASSAYLKPEFADMSMSGMTVTVIDDADFDRILEDNGISRDKYYEGTLRGILLNGIYHEEGEREVFEQSIKGQSLHYDVKEGFPPAVEIADLVRYDEDTYVYQLMPKGTISVYVPASVYFAKAAETLPADSLTCDLGVVTKQHGEVHDRIYELLESGGYTHYYVADMATVMEAMNTVTLLLRTAMFGFTILLTLIAVANIINTISNGVLLRRREFAMYRSLGLADNGFKKMLRLETLLYGIKALVWGLPISLVLSYVMYRNLSGRLYTFDPEWIMYVCAVAAVFAIVGLSMLLSVSRIRDDSIIETLKEDTV